MVSNDLLNVIRGHYTVALAGLTIGVYTLLVTGASVSLLEAAAACQTWPSCDGVWIVSIDEPTIAIALGHRFVSIVVGVTLVVVTIIAWTIDTPKITQWTLTGAMALFPLQIGLGAIAAISGGSRVIATIHLLLAIVIFVATLLALMGWLETRTRNVTSRFGTGQTRSNERGPDSNPELLPTKNRWTVLKSYLSLTKPRLMWLLCIVALAGMGLASTTMGLVVTREVVIGTLLGGVLAIGASGTFNHVLERDIDRNMRRTDDRPIPSERIPVRNAIAFGTVLGVGSVVVFFTFTTVLATALGVFAIIFYSIIYTLVLKPRTTQNIVIGGAVGALPALIGWAAVTGSIGVPALVLGLVIFLWTPAHFYNLALVYWEDYERAGFPMLPVVRGEQVTRRHIVYYLGATLIGVGLLGAVSGLGWLFAATAVLFAAVFLVAVIGLYRQRTPTAAMRSFHASNAFLGALMVVIVVETLMLPGF